MLCYLIYIYNNQPHIQLELRQTALGIHMWTRKLYYFILFICQFKLAHYFARHTYCSSSCWYGFVNQCHRTYHGILAYLNVMACRYRCTHTYVCTIFYYYLVMFLLSSMTGKIHSIRDCHIVANNNLINTKVIEIAFHPDKASLAYLKTTKSVKCNTDRR